MSYLIVEKNEHPTDWDDAESIKKYKYPLDYFQKLAVRAMNKGDNVMACVATGSGKSTLADYAIALSFSKGKRVIFTSPIKALSNQKYKEFKEAYGAENVGLMTGDNKFNPDARCIIMTAEILQNLLYKEKSWTKSLGITSQLSLEDVDTVVMDEVHYINNDDRGKVWESTLVMIPPEIKLVLLSATINHPEHMANWIGNMKKVPIHLISNTKRIIPLTHYVYKPTRYENLATEQEQKDALIKIMDNDGHWSSNGEYTKWAKIYDKIIDETFAPDSKEYQLQANKTYKGQNRLNNLIDYLKLCNLCPAICFVFSRKNCEMYAGGVQQYLISPKESAEVEKIFHFYTNHYKQMLEKTPQYYSVLDTIKKGVAYHHSGLIPILKEVIEIIFSKGFIKVLFATETFAVGLNMPAKTTIFTSVRKPDGLHGGSKRLIYTDEYLQMSGRAGRRGLDKQGFVIHCPMYQPESEGDMRKLMTGKTATIKSKMDFGFEFIFKSLHSQVFRWGDIVKESYWYQELLEYKNGCRESIEDLKGKISKINGKISESERLVLEERFNVEQEMKKNKTKQLQKQLSQWKNKYFTKKWEDLYKEWKTVPEHQVQMKLLENDYETVDDLQIFMGSYANFLERAGFLKDLPENLEDLCHENLTEKGVLATEINEGNRLLMSELYLWYCEDRERLPSPEEIMSILAMFINGDRLRDADSSVPNSPSLDFIDNKIGELDSSAMSLNIHLKQNAWNLNCDWSNITYDWLAGIEFSELVETYGIDEGDLLRGILKVVNLLDEWRSLATYRGDVWMLEYMEGIETKLMHDMVIPDSLYLRH